MDEPRIQTVITYSINLNRTDNDNDGVRVNSKEKKKSRSYRLKIYKLLAKFVSLT